MRLLLLFLSPLALAVGCTSTAGDSDSAGVVDTDTDDEVDTEDTFECPTPEMHVTGNDPPVVGDYWEVFLWCDDTLMTGAMHMSIDPPTMATIENYYLTFNEEGTGTLSVQVGTIRAEREVVVGPAEGP